MPGAVDERNPDAQAAQQSEVEEQIAKVRVLDDGAVKSDDENLVPILGHIAQDFAQVDESLQRPGGFSGAVCISSHTEFSIERLPHSSYGACGREQRGCVDAHRPATR